MESMTWTLDCGEFMVIATPQPAAPQPTFAWAIIEADRHGSLHELFIIDLHEWFVGKAGTHYKTCHYGARSSTSAEQPSRHSNFRRVRVTSNCGGSCGDGNCDSCAARRASCRLGWP